MIVRLLISILVALCLSQLCRADCNVDKYMCHNKRCINRLHVCDGDNDCNDNSDENICVPGVCNNPALFKCKDGKSCISVLKVCDGSNNCGDGYDETECGLGTCSHPALFRCDDGLCIAKRFVCDGTQNCYDNSDEKICMTGILAIPDIRRSREQGISWLISKRNSKWGWDDNTHRVIVALYLASGATFNGTNEEEELMAKQLELRVALSLLRNKTNPVSSNHLALYINAMLVTCQNPRKFHGFDIIKILKNQIKYKETSTHPLIYLALCNANETIADAAVDHLFSMLDHESEYLFWIDIQAMSIMALTCITRQNKHAHFAENVTTAVENFKRKQRTDGSFGNVHTTALVVQALLASGHEEDSDWDVTGAVKYLQSKQSINNSFSFGDLVATYLTLPILRVKTLADIVNVKCTSLRRQPRDGNSIVDVKNQLGPKIYLQYSLYVGDEKDIVHSVSLRVPANITVYDVMRLAAEADAKYKFEYKNTNGNKYVFSISSIANDPEIGMFWLLYITDQNEMSPTVITQSPDKIIVKGGEHIIMWYKTADIQSKRSESIGFVNKTTVIESEGDGITTTIS